MTTLQQRLLLKTDILIISDHRVHRIIFWWYFNAFIKKISALKWKSVISWFFMVACLHTHGEVRYFDNMRCRTYCWLIQCKNYQNRSKIAKVAAKSLLWCFLHHSVITSICTISKVLKCYCRSRRHRRHHHLHHNHHLS